MFEPNTAFTQLVDEAVASWGEIYYGHAEFAAGIANLYRIWLAEHLPASWPPQRRETFITNHADQAAAELGTLFDDLIDTITNDHGLAYGTLIHHEDHAAILETARRDALDDHRDTCYYELLTAIEQECDDDPGRGDGSMTSCGRTGRRRRPRTTAEVNILYRRYGY